MSSLECYNILVDNNFDGKKIYDICKEKNVDVFEVLTLATEYNNNINDNYYEWRSTIRKIREFIKDYKKVDEFISRNNECRKLYYELKANSFNDFENKLYKYCYDFCLSNNFDLELVNDRANVLGLSIKRFKKYAEDFAFNQQIINKKPTSIMYLQIRRFGT